MTFNIKEWEARKKRELTLAAIAIPLLLLFSFRDVVWLFLQVYYVEVALGLGVVMVAGAFYSMHQDMKGPQESDAD